MMNFVLRKKIIGSALLLIVLIFILAPAANAQRRRFTFRSDYLKNNPQFVKLFRQVVAPARKSTVEILDNKIRVALGAIVDAGGLILTKASKAGDDATVKLPDGRVFAAKPIARHDKHDLVLLQIDASSLTPVQWRPSKKVPVGSWAVSAGLATNPISLGVVSVSMRKVLPPRFTLNRAFLGVEIVPSKDGAMIKTVVKDSAAESAKLKSKDIILVLAGKKVSNAETVRKALAPFNPGDSVAIRIQRGEKEMVVKAVLKKRKASRGEIQNSWGSKLSKRKTGFPYVLQHDGVVRPNECGGPLVDLDGKVIGINISRVGRTETHAIPSEIVMQLLNEMKAGKHRVKAD